MARARATDLSRRVLAFVRRHGLVEAGDTLVVAVSGGPDSVCLLHLLWRLRGQLGLSLHVAHLDHQLRGAESRADADYVAELARRLGLPATVEARDVSGYRAQRQLGLEEAARQVRYEFLAKVASAVGARSVAVGHTADDQAETILMHLVRGSGLSGLRGMRPLAPWPGPDGPELLRPLLEVRRPEVESYCRAHDLQPRVDATNLELTPLRNRLRHEVLPLLEKLNPAVVAALVRTGRAAASDLDFIEAQVAEHWGQVVSQIPGGLALDRGYLMRLHPSLRRHILRRALETVAGQPRDVEAVHVEQALALLDKPAGRRLSLLKGLSLYADYTRLVLGAEPAALCPLPPLGEERCLQVPGTAHISGWTATAQLMPPGSGPPATEGAVDIDFAAAGADLVVRSRRQGDRFQPLGMSQPKKLQDFLVDEKVPQYCRGRVPLVVSPRGVIWVVGYRIAHWARVTEATRQVLRLELRRRST